MKKYILAAVAALVVLTGCTATKSVITEYDKDGKAVKVTESSESVVTTLTKSTKDKTVIAWESGWAAYLSASAATQEDPTPTVKLFAGKTDKGLISALKDQNWERLPDVIRATKYELKVGTSGFTSAGVADTKNKEDTK
jgi:hypothetical protein